MLYLQYLILFYLIFLLLIETNHNIIELISLDTSNKKIKQNVKHLFEQHTPDYCNLQERMLQLKQEKLAILKERLELKKKDHEDHTRFFKSFLEKMDELMNIVRSIGPQYLED